MAKKNIPFGTSPTDDLVKRWLDAKGIAPDDVSAYAINRGSDDTPTIVLTMYYDESALVQQETDTKE